MNYLLYFSRLRLTRSLCGVVLLLLTTSNASAGVLSIPGLRGPFFSIKDNHVRLELSCDELMMDGGLTYMFGGNTHSYLELSPHLTSEATIIKLSLSLKDASNSCTICLPSHLPGERAFPGIFSDSLPTIAIELKESRVRIYMGDELLGVFIPMHIGIPHTIATFRLRSDRQKIGNISVVGLDKDGKNSGLFFLLNTKGYMKEIMDLYIQKKTP